MNDRAVSLLEQYDIEVIRTKKGRGAILCECTEGLFIMKEFTGSKEKAEILDRLLSQIQETDGVSVERILRNKEGELLTTDQDGISYIVKTWFEGRECNVKNYVECEKAVRTLAHLHDAMTFSEPELLMGLPVFSLKAEYERHNRELKRVRRFLKEKSQKSEFEIFLNQNFDYFLNQGRQILEDWNSYAYLEKEEDIHRQATLCHGDFQYHNIIVTDGDMSVINFEKYILDQPVRDLYLFMRKILEKSNWAQEVGERLLSAYDKVRPLSAADRITLYYRFAYPEKFWKIVNFYYNSGKAWIPGKNMEKLEKVLQQEKEKQKFLEQVFCSL